MAALLALSAIAAAQMINNQDPFLNRAGFDGMQPFNRDEVRKLFALLRGPWGAGLSDRC